MTTMRTPMLLAAGLAATLGCQTASRTETDSGTDGDADADADGDTDADTDWGDVHGEVEECWDTGGEPSCWGASGIDVIAMNQDSDSFGPAVTGAGGEYLLPLPPGVYDVTANPHDEYAGLYSEATAFGVVVGEGESVERNFTIWADVDAPYVYLYPEQAMQVDVTLLPANGMSITDSEPEYGGGWSVWAEPSGLLDGQWDYLFYEATVLWVFQNEEGWAVPAPEIFEWFAAELPELGLTGDETADFMEYWTAHLPYAPCYRVFPQPLAIVEQEMGLVIDPAPDSVLRLWLMIEGEAECGELPAPTEEPFVRAGFAVVEWGVALYGPSFE